MIKINYSELWEGSWTAWTNKSQSLEYCKHCSPEYKNGGHMIWMEYGVRYP